LFDLSKRDDGGFQMNGVKVAFGCFLLGAVFVVGAVAVWLVMLGAF